MTIHYDLVPTGVGDPVVYAWDGVRLAEFALPPLAWNRESPSSIWVDSPGEIVDFSAAFETRVVRFGVRMHIKINVPAMPAKVTDRYIQDMANLQTWSIRNHNNTKACMVILPHRDNQQIWFLAEVTGNFEYGYINGKMTGMSGNFEMTGTELLDSIPIGGDTPSQWGARAGIAYGVGDRPYIDQWASRIKPWYPGHVFYGDTIGAWTIGGGLTYVTERVWTSSFLIKSAALTGAGGGICTYNYSGSINQTIQAMIRSRQVAGDASFGIIYRQTGNNYYFVECDSVVAPHEIVLYKVVGGVLTALGTWTNNRVAPQSWFWLKVVASGTTHKVYIADPVTVATTFGIETTVTAPSTWFYVGGVTDAAISATGETGIKTGAGSEMQLAVFNDSGAAYAAGDLAIVARWSARRRQHLPFDLP